MSALTARLGRIIRPLQRFAQARGGNVSILFGLSLIPLIGLAGLGTDYGIAFSAKAKLDNAADAAALAAVATAKAYVANNQSDPNLSADAIAAGLDRATRAFTVNAGSVPLTQLPTPSITLTQTGQTFNATVAYNTTTTAQFGQMFGASNLAVGGSVAATAQIPSYLDFYLLIDESGSMGIPTAAADQATLANVNNGCQFACHFSDPVLANISGGWGYNIATTGYNKHKVGSNYVNYQQLLTTPLQLRSGAVNIALCQLLTMAAAPSVPNQYRVGLYPFIDQVATLSALTTNISSLQQTADCSSNPPMALTAILDTGTTQGYTNGNPTTGTGSGGTHFETTLPGMQSLVQTYGDGSSSSYPKPFVFLITDGMDNGQHYSVKSGSSNMYVGNPNVSFQSYTSSSSGFDGSSPQLFSTSYCNGLKNAGATLSILYIPYVNLAVGPSNQGETIAVDNLIPQVANNLQNCASPGFFYTASSQAAITAALNAMFNQAVQVAHLSK